MPTQSPRTLKKLATIAAQSLLIATILGASSTASPLSQDSNEAHLWRESCDGGEMDSCVNLGVLYENGHGVAQDFIESIKLYLQACDGGSAVGCTYLGRNYWKGIGLDADIDLSMHYFHRGCEGNDKVACSQLGVFYFMGIDVEADLEKGITYLRKGCDLGYQKACTVVEAASKEQTSPNN